MLINVLGGGGSTTGLPGGIGSPGDVGHGSNASSVDNTQLSNERRTGADADSRSDCAIVADIDSVQAFWNQELPVLGATYTRANTVFFSGRTSTGCGAADAGVGPFYCRADRLVYIDLSFLDQLRTQFGAAGGAFVNTYVLAHEYGHHVQDLLGIESRINHSQTGATSDSVRLELQAIATPGYGQTMPLLFRPATGGPSSRTSPRPTSSPHSTPPDASAMTGSRRTSAVEA